MAKGIMVIDGQRVPFDGERNVLAVIRKAGIDIPTFCYYSDLSVHGACRMCIVEDVKTGKIDASCSMEPRDGMEIRTNTARLLRHRRMILELLLAAWPSALACGISVSPTISPGTRRITPATRCSGTPTSASCAATACGCARSCRDRAF